MTAPARHRKAAARRAGLIAGLMGDTTKPTKPSRAYAAGARAGATLRAPAPAPGRRPPADER